MPLASHVLRVAAAGTLYIGNSDLNGDIVKQRHRMANQINANAILSV